MTKPNALTRLLAGMAAALGISAGVAAAAPSGLVRSDKVWFSPAAPTATQCHATYKITIRTGTKRGAGTDSNISLELKGYKGRTFKTGAVNKHLVGNVFESGDSDTLFICMNGQAIGHVSQVTIRSDDRYSGSDWLPASVSITHPDGKTAMFTYGTWIEDKGKAYKKNCTVCVPAGAKWNVYDVAIKTSNDGGAGTDSNIAISLVDNHGSSTRVLLNQMDNGNIFEKGDLDTFTIWSAAGIGDIATVMLESDGKYAGADWHVSTVAVTDRDRNETVFEFQRWINDDTPDIQRIGRPRIEFQNGRSVQVQQAEYRFWSALADDGFEDSFEFQQSSERVVELLHETGSTIGVEATVGYSSGDKAGWSGSATSSYAQHSGKSMADLDKFAMQVKETRNTKINPGTLRVGYCTWTTPYDVYDIESPTSGLKPIGFISAAPKCAFNSTTFPNDVDNTMDRPMLAALRAQYKDGQADRPGARRPGRISVG